MRTAPEDRRERGRGPSRVLAALGGVLVVAALASPFLDHGSEAPEQASRTQSATGTAEGRPVRLVVPSLGISAPVTPVELDGSALVPPSDPQVVGWWRSGGVPGAERGTAVVAGHTVHTGGGALDHLDELRRGDRFAVATDHGTIAYVVTSARIFSKSGLATHAEQLFSQSVPGRLALVTCDDWNGTTYESNAVVLARPRPRGQAVRVLVPPPVRLLTRRAWSA